ncbi:uncharacterized protein LOC108674441 [Hyalella azteca]|uniref:Uncharacterized protein LOC108674441 n=1 Tax=Hyalella azteca TaxID=294128 RepID=A0A8B7NVS7_HYAAZ|nr:uncharacterized protein LOC108674441 [Hyalella azteca]
MNLGLVLLAMAAASVSALTVSSSCYLALTSGYAILVNASQPCFTNYTTNITRYTTTAGCYSKTQAYNATFCDPIISGYMKCSLKVAGLLKPNGSFNDAAFKSTMLQNKCSSPATRRTELTRNTAN